MDRAPGIQKSVTRSESLGTGVGFTNRSDLLTTYPDEKQTGHRRLTSTRLDGVLSAGLVDDAPIRLHVDAPVHFK